jgi:MFS family permease
MTDRNTHGEAGWSEVAGLAAPEMQTPRAMPAGFLPRTFDSLRDREFRWFYVSMLGQMAAIHTQMVVRGFFAFVLTGSYAILGLVSLAGAAPMLVLSVVGGVAADRLPKKTVLQVGLTLDLVNVMVLAGLVFFDLMRIELLIVSAVAHGGIMSLTLPTRQSMIPEILGTGRLMNAISLNTAGMNTVRLFSPAAGGVIAALAGFGWAFLAIAALYAVGLVGLARVGWRPAASPVENSARRLSAARSGLHDIGEGIRYVGGHRLIGSILGVTFISAIFAFPYLFLLPGYVADIFGGGGSEVGLLISVSAIGSLGGALVLASMPDRRRGLTLLGGILTIGVGLFAFAQTESYWVGAVMMVVVGVGAALYQALSQGLLQSYVDNAYLGRVMSLYFTQFSVMQLGTFLVGVLAESIGIRVAFAGMGVGLMLVTACVFLLVPRVRRLD